MYGCESWSIKKVEQLSLFHSHSSKIAVAQCVIQQVNCTFKSDVRGHFMWLHAFICSFFFLLLHAVYGILVPWPGIEPQPPALEAQNLNPRTTREIPILPFFLSFTFNCSVISSGKPMNPQHSYFSGKCTSPCCSHLLCNCLEVNEKVRIYPKHQRLPITHLAQHMKVLKTICWKLNEWLTG